MRVPTILAKYTPVRRLVLYLLEAPWVRVLVDRIPFSQAPVLKVS